MSSTTAPARVSEITAVFGDSHLHAEGDLLALRYDDDGQLWSVEEPGILRQWDTASGDAKTTFSLSDLETLWGFGPHARLLASASDDLSIWDARTGEVLKAISQPSWVTAFAFHPKQALVATGHDDGKVRVWDINKQKLARELSNHTEPISALAFAADGKKLAVASEDKLISLWQTSDGKYLGALEGHKDRIPALAWHPDGKRLVSAGWDTTARVWDVQSFEPVILLNYHDTQVYALAFSPDGKLLATADSGRQVPIWVRDWSVRAPGDCRSGIRPRRKWCGSLPRKNRSTRRPTAPMVNGLPAARIHTSASGTPRTVNQPGCWMGRRNRLPPWRLLRMARRWPAEVPPANQSGCSAPRMANRSSSFPIRSMVAPSRPWYFIQKAGL
jgi:hypothetical protein